MISNTTRHEFHQLKEYLGGCKTYNLSTLECALKILKGESSSLAAEARFIYIKDTYEDRKIARLFQKILPLNGSKEISEQLEKLLIYVEAKLTDALSPPTLDLTSADILNVSLRGELEDVKRWMRGCYICPELLKEGFEIAIEREDLSVASYIFDRFDSNEGHSEPELIKIVQRLDEKKIDLFQRRLLDSIFIQAASKNYVNCIRVFNELGFFITDTIRSEAVGGALKKGHENCVKELLLDYDDLSSKGWTRSFLRFYEEKYLKLLPIILEKGLSISESSRLHFFVQTAEFGKYPLMKALSTIAALIPESVRHAAFIKACGNGHLECVKELLKDKTLISENARKEAFRSATKCGHLDCIKELLQDGWIISEERKGDAVIESALAGRVECLKEILKGRGTISEKDRKQAIHLAKQWHKGEIKDQLLMILHAY